MTTTSADEHYQAYPRFGVLSPAHCSSCLCCSAGAGTERGTDVMNGGKVHSAPSSAFRSSVVFDYEMWLLQNLAQSWFKHRDPCDFQFGIGSCSAFLDFSLSGWW